MLRLKFMKHMLPLVMLLLTSLAGADVLDDVLERGTLRVGVSEFVPWTIRTDGGELIGFEIDVANKIAADMGVKTEFKVYPWETIIPALQRNEIDMIAGGMAITPARALQVNFSRPLGKSGVGIATNTQMTQNIGTLDELNNKEIIIATVADSLAASVARTLFDKATIRVYASTELAEKELLEGRAHAYLANLSAVTFLVLRNPLVADLPVAEPLLASSEALAVKKGEQQFLNFLDAWVTARQTDKWLATTRDYWFGSLDWAARMTRK